MGEPGRHLLSPTYLDNRVSIFTSQSQQGSTPIHSAGGEAAPLGKGLSCALLLLAVVAENI